MKCAPNPPPADLMCGEVCDFRPLEADRPRTRAQCAGDQVKGRTLAGAVRADQAKYLAFAYFEGNLVDGQESSEAFGKPFDRQHQVRMA